MRHAANGLALLVVTVLAVASVAPGSPASSPPAPLALPADALLALELQRMNAAAWTDDLARSVALAKAVTLAQTPGTDASSAPALREPAAAARDVLARWGVAVEPHTEALAAMDALPAPARAALAGFLDAYLAFDAASRARTAGLDPVALAFAAENLEALGMVDAPEDALTLPRPSPEAFAGLEAARTSHGPVLLARARLLDASIALREALDEAGPLPREASLNAPPALAIDLAGVDSVHEASVALSIDVGGNDVYFNNAGGSNVLGPTCIVSPACVPGGGAAAAIDLQGDDRYAGVRPGGMNGGGALGAGFLLDALGDDVYTGAGVAVNGGGGLGSGFLLDAAGADQYTGGALANGGAQVAGLGLLVDGGGSDVYRAWIIGVNGGGSLLGAGYLLDAGGDDTFLALACGANGGGFDHGAGAFVDLGGDDRYASSFPPYALGNGANGGGFVDGHGFLFDALGNDRYEGGSAGTNGGSVGLSSGFLWDLAGDDAYRARHSGVNGGGDFGYTSVPYVVAPGTGTLLDSAGLDTFEEDGYVCANPASCVVLPKGTGAQFDL